VPKVRSCFIALIVVLVLAPATAVAEGKRSPRPKPAPVLAQAAQECADADLEPDADNLPRIRAAIVCLHNEIRAGKGLPELRQAARLRQAAVGHSRDMVADRYFEHTTPKGQTMVDRILRARYVREDQGWMLGENLAWGTGSLSTPRGAVESWMASPGHRANIVKRGYRDIGVGVVLGVPVSDAAGATYTIDFGVRR
jgi:uncharacterized protein YkwD